jgi:hypothetical protein
MLSAERLAFTAHTLDELGMIREPLPYMIDVEVSLLEEGSYVVVIYGIVDDISLSPWFDEASIA